MLNLLSLFFVVFVSVSTSPVFAGPGRTTYQAKIVKPDGLPLEASSVNFKFTILDPVGSCILYSETYSSVNMAATGGLISFALGSGVKTYPASATTFQEIFSNITPTLSCDAGGPGTYSPGANDIRKIVMQFHDGTGWQTLPAMSINAVPYAMYADDATKLNGLTSSDFVQLSTVPTCGVGEALRYTGASFNCIAVGGGVTSSTVVTALGYTPADGASVTTLTSDVSSVSSTLFSVSTSVTSLQSTVAASFAAITSSQWVTSGTNIFYNTGNIGIGIATPAAKLDVSGGLRISMDAATCATGLAGTLRYNSGTVEYCNGTTWLPFGVAGAGITNINGSTSGSQSFATGTGGTAPNFNTSNGVHTLNIPLASTGAVTAGLLSNSDYVNFSNKITSSAASIAQVLGYVPANDSASGTYAQKTNNLSDLTSVATARTNLGLGTFATASSIDLGGASATGTLAIARLPSFTGDATIAAASNTIVLANSGVTAGAYTKVTVDSKGRVTSGSAISSSDVTTALGYTPANSASATQWQTSGTAISYVSGNVGIGTSSPTARLDVAGDIYVNGLTVGRGGGNDFSNVAFGRNALISNTTGWQNVAVGEYAMENAANGMQNTALGSYAMRYDLGSTNNVAVGTYAMENNSSGSYNVAIGVFALDGNNTGTDNVAIGEQALLSNTTGSENVGIGRFSGVFNQTGSSNVLIGNRAGYGASGASNYLNSTVIGYYAGNSLRTAGSNNILIGYKAGDQITTGAKNIVIGYDIDTPTVTTSNSLNIGNLIYGSGLNGSGTTVSTGNIGLGTTNPTAKLHLAAGTTSTAPFKLTSGTLLTSAQSGTMEYDGFNLYFTDGANTRRTIAMGEGVTSSSVVAALGYTPANSATVASITSSQWTTSGSTINFSSGNVGIGTGNPTQALEVSGSIRGSRIIASDGAFNAPSITFAGSANTGFYNSSGSIGFSVAGALRGIMSSSSFSFNSGGAGPQIYFTGGNEANPSYAFNVDSDTGMYNPNASGGSNELGFSTAGTEKLRIASSGAVGIGTKTPTSKLHINGDLNGSPQVPAVALDINNWFNLGHATGYGYISWFTKGDGTQFVNTHATQTPAVIKAISGALTFQTSTATGSGTPSSLTDRMTILNSGNIGIGTTNPSYPLDVKNEMRIGAQGGSDVTRIAGGSGYGSQIYQYYADGVLRNLFSANGNSYITGANFGVGTSAPTVKLDVSDNAGRSIRISPTGYAGDFLNMPLIHLENTNNVADDWLLVNNADKFYIATEASAGSEKLTVAASGYVGIGTSNPTQLLQVGSGSSNAVAEVRGNGAGYSAGLRVWNTNTAVGAYSYLDFGWGVSAAVASIHARSQTDNSTNLVFQPSTTNGTRFDGLTINGATGNVGVGVVGVASATLDVAAPTTSAENIRLRGKTAIEGGQISLMDGTGTGGWEIDNYGASGTERLRFFRDKGENNIVEPMVIAPTGYVGVKNIDPQAVLDVGGSVLLRGGAAHAETSPSYGGTFFSFDGATNTAGLWSVNASTSQFAFYTKTGGTDAGTERLRITSTGNVGIGTSAPVSKLNIGGMGAANATALRIDSQDTYYRDIFMSEFNTTTYGGILRYNSGLDLLSLITMEAGVEKYGVAVARATGFVGIGMNAAASYPLDVNGDIRITGTPYRNGGDSAWIVPSDARLKDVSGKYNRGLREIANIDTIYFNYKKDNPKQIDSSVTYTGVLAQQVQKQIPEAVKEDKEGFLSLNTTPIFWAMLNAVKELYYDVVGIKTENAQLKAQAVEQARKIQSLEEENAAIKERLDRLEKSIQNNK